MFKHVVMWKLNDDGLGSEKVENAEAVKSSLERLPSLIPQIKSYEVGINLQDADRTFDVVLLSEFSDQTSFELYRSHPEHLKVVEVIRELTSEARFVDFVTDNE